MVKLGNIVKGILFSFFCYVTAFLPTFSFAAPQSRYQVLRQSVPWDPEGQNYDSYDQFKSDLVFSFKTAISRIVIASVYLSDNDIWAAAYAARMRGIKVSVLLDKKTNEKPDPSWRKGTYGLRPVLTQLVPEEMEGYATIVIDRSVWRVSIPLDVDLDENLRVDRSPFTAPEVELWAKNGTTQPLPNNASSSSKKSANPPTSDAPPKLQIFGNMKRRTNRPKSAGTVPRVLPRETRFQKLKRGVDTEVLQGDGPGKSTGQIPQASENESDLEE